MRSSTPASCASQKPTSSADGRPSVTGPQTRVKSCSPSAASSFAAKRSSSVRASFCSTSRNCASMLLTSSARCCSAALSSFSFSSTSSKRTPRRVTRAAVASSKRTCTESREKYSGMAKRSCSTSLSPVVAGSATVAHRRTCDRCRYTVSASALESVRTVTIAEAPPLVVSTVPAGMCLYPLLFVL
ncbi:hypothetical protein DQ04_10141000 [Trypanosoma grayi]|uniref:hypothetical protein n=1 Tax=Trypanosoma grayi TaxID=71804 RepID=UPI0004F444CA|nr:hypothetical protein DQ04_10141000 [Trypanosoma grayi]KEG07333.1 hypothetical protein DQ04_10141000 [Trypanosoma grayi]